MTGDSFVIVIDTPSVKSFVFGTDSLNEVRGASARLDSLNRDETERCLREHLEVTGQARLEPVYANGGSAQFLVHGCEEAAVKTACASMVRYVREQTGGDVQVVYGVAPFQDEASYQESVRMAHFLLRCQREFATCHRSASLLPPMMECQSASLLPASRIVRGPDGNAALSETSYGKRRQGRAAHQHGLWAEWMRYLEDRGPWPSRREWDMLRCKSMTDIGNDIGVVYADGNGMGKFVQALDRPETLRQFSRLVDESIREACFAALSQVCGPQVDNVRNALERHQRFEPLSADVLLLGGDDLLVAVPADRALDFSLRMTREFERLTKAKIDCLKDETTRKFFRDRDRVGDGGFTISCGVAIARSNYPFYLALDLAEQLLKNAKRQDSHHPQPGAQGVARIDFHVAAGANSHALKQVREDTYRVGTHTPRTLRPLSCSQLECLHTGVQGLRDAGFPRSKLHELQEAALAARENRAEWQIHDIFARCRRPERRALWQAINDMCPAGHTFDFPWFGKDEQRLLCVADVVEAYDLFPK